MTSDIRVNVAFRASPDTRIEREFAAICQVDPADPAHASAHGWHVNRTIRPNQTIQGRCDTVIQSTATHFHVTIDLELRVNDAVHATRRWTQTIPRNLLCEAPRRRSDVSVVSDGRSAETAFGRMARSGRLAPHP